MPRSFDVSVESPASVEQVLSAFGDEDYWRTRLAGNGNGAGTLNSLVVGADGTVTVNVTASLFGSRLPKLITRLHRGDLELDYNETWSPIGDGRVRGEVSIAIPGAPFSAPGVALLTPTGNGSRLKYTTTVAVKIPLVGGKIEGIIGGHVSAGIAATQRFTTEWIAENR